MSNHIVVSVSPFYNGHGWTDHGTGIKFEPSRGLKAVRIEIREETDLRGIRNSIRLNNLLLLEGELPANGDPRAEDINPGELSHEQYTKLLSKLRAQSDNGEELEALEGELEEARTSITSLQSQLNEEQGKVSTLEGNLREAAADITGLESELETAEGNVSSLQADLDSKTSELATKESELSTANAQVSTLQSDKSALEAERDTLAGDKTVLEEEVSNLRTENESLRAQLEALEGGEEDPVEPASLPAEDPKYTQAQLESKTIAELQDLAADEGIELTATKKADIVQEILDKL